MAKNAPRKITRKRRAFNRKQSLIERDVQLLRNWAKRDAEVELIVPNGGVALAYVGHIVEVSISDDFDDFMFLSSASKLRVLLYPWSWRQSKIEKTGGVYVSIYISEGGRSSTHVCIRETLIKRKPNQNLSKALAQLKSWAQSNTKLLILFGSGPHWLAFFGNANAISDAQFSLSEEKSAQLQLLVTVSDFEYIDVKQEGERAFVTLAHADSEWTCSIATAPTRIQDLFKQVPLRSKYIH